MSYVTSRGPKFAKGTLHKKVMSDAMYLGDQNANVAALPQVQSTKSAAAPKKIKLSIDEIYELT